MPKLTLPNKHMLIYIVAGERSGDLHGGNLIGELKTLLPQATFRGVGGHFMAEQGMVLFKSYKEISFMGFLEVLAHAPKLLGAVADVKKDIAACQPHLVIYIDSGGFNMRLAPTVKALGIKSFYYIAPKIWAWNTKRVRKIKAYIDRVFVILPFEKAFYEQNGVMADYIGNPILDAIAQFSPNPAFRAQEGLDSRNLIAILPGSRKQEIENMLHVMVSIIPAYPNHQFVVAGVSNLPRKYYEQFRRYNQIRIVYDKTYDLLSQAEAALVTSGTATLETALFRVPQVVCYKTTFITASIVRMVIKVKFISLVNLIAGREVVRELIQEKFITQNLNLELKKLLFSPIDRARVLADYDELIAQMGQPGASKLAAQKMASYL